jgi:hypothetical protein
MKKPVVRLKIRVRLSDGKRPYVDLRLLPEPEVEPEGREEDTLIQVTCY